MFEFGRVKRAAEALLTSFSAMAGSGSSSSSELDALAESEDDLGLGLLAESAVDELEPLDPPLLEPGVGLVIHVDKQRLNAQRSTKPAHLDAGA